MAVIKLLVNCGDISSIKQWGSPVRALAEAEIIPLIAGTEFASALAHEIKRGNRFLICDEEAWFPSNIGKRARRASEQLDREYSSWALCGNEGTLCAGQRTIRFVKRDRFGLDWGQSAHPALAICGNAALVAGDRLRNTQIPASALAGNFTALIDALSRAALANRLLLCVHPALATIVGTQFATFLDRPPVSDPILNPSSEQLRDFDAALVVSRRKPLVSIVCRTQLHRPALLARAIASFSQNAREAADLMDLNVHLVSDASQSALEYAGAELSQIASGLNLQTWHVNARAKTTSRIDLLVSAIRSIDADFLWFVDDDDFILPGGARWVGRRLRAMSQAVLIGDANVYFETWTKSNGERPMLGSQTLRHKYASSDWPACFLGHNAIHLSSIVFPLQRLRERLAELDPSMEYVEDYFLLMLLLMDGMTEVDCLNLSISGVSIRSSDNVVTQPDKTTWNLSYSSCLAELSEHAGIASNAMWVLADRYARLSHSYQELVGRHESLADQNTQTLQTLSSILRSRSWRWSAPIRALLRYVRRR